MPGVCKRDGCERVARSRGMCNSHYTMWRRSTTVDTTPVFSKERALDALPGTYAQVAANAGMCYETARKALKELHADGQIHIEDIIPPTCPGGKYVNVFAFGPGEDARVSPQFKRSNALRGRRIRHAVTKAVIPDPLVAALFGRTKPASGKSA